MRPSETTVVAPAGPSLAGAWRAWTLPIVGLAYVLVLLLGFLRPLAIWRFPTFIDTKKEQLAVALGDGRAGALYFTLCLVFLSALYVIALYLVREQRLQRHRWLVFAFPVAFVAALIFVTPLGSKDIYHYIAEGRIFAHYGQNAIVTPPSTYPADPLLSITAPWDKVASRYGPVWALLTYVPARLAGDSFVANIVAFKALMSVFYLATLPLLYLTAERVRAGTGFVATVFFAWNPLLVFDVLFNGHNDMPMLFFAVAAVYLSLTGRWRLAFLALTASVLVKFVTAILFPILLVYLLRSSRTDRWRVALEGLALCAVTTIALYFPFWEGMRTFAAIRQGSDWVTNSPTTLVIDTLSLRFGRSLVVLIVQRLLFLSFIATYALILWRTRPDRGVQSPIVSGFWAFYLYLMVIAWWFWPWYVLWLVPLAALLQGRREATLAVIFSVSALFGHVIYDWKEMLGWEFGRPFQLSAGMTLIVFAPAWAYLLSTRLPFFRWRTRSRQPSAWTDKALQP